MMSFIQNLVTFRNNGEYINYLFSEAWNFKRVDVDLFCTKCTYSSRLNRIVSAGLRINNRTFMHIETVCQLFQNPYPDPGFRNIPVQQLGCLQFSELLYLCVFTSTSNYFNKDVLIV